MIALIIGLIIPVVFILGKDYLNDTIVEREDVEKITSKYKKLIEAQKALSEAVAAQLK